MRLAIAAGLALVCSPVLAQQCLTYQQVVTSLEGDGSKIVGAASYEGWFGLWGPGRMAPEIVQRINAEANAAAATEAVQARFRTLAVVPGALDVAGVASLMREDAARWARAAEQGLLRRAS